MLSIIAHFFPIFIGLQIIKNKYNLNIFELISHFFGLSIISNIINYIFIGIFTNHEFLYFTVWFFVKFSLLNIIITLIVTLIYILIRENISINIYVRNKNEKKYIKKN